MIVLYMPKKLKIKSLFCILCFLFLNNQVTAKLKISGCFCEGGLIFGQVSENSIVTIDKKRKKIFNDGFFIHAFGRKSKQNIEIDINGIKKNYIIKKKNIKLKE